MSTPPNDKHLFVVIAPTQNEKYICVNITSKRSNSDTACILRRGDHPFIKHTSVINYKKAREVAPAIVLEQIGAGNCVIYQSVSSTLLYKIQKGGIESARLKNKFKNYLKSFMKQ